VTPELSHGCHFIDGNFDSFLSIIDNVRVAKLARVVLIVSNGGLVVCDLLVDGFETSVCSIDTCIVRVVLPLSHLLVESGKLFVKLRNRGGNGLRLLLDEWGNLFVDVLRELLESVPFVEELLGCLLVLVFDAVALFKELD
jgi:hypothetical protein